MMEKDYISEAKKYIALGDIDATLKVLIEGVKAKDEKCAYVMYYLPKKEKITWRDKSDYLKRNFATFNLDISFDQFVRETGPILHHDLFEECAIFLKVSIEELRTYDYVNWCLEKIYKVSKIKIVNFWNNFYPNFYQEKLINSLKSVDFYFNQFKKYEKKSNFLTIARNLLEQNKYVEALVLIREGIGVNDKDCLIAMDRLSRKMVQSSNQLEPAQVLKEIIDDILKDKKDYISNEDFKNIESKLVEISCICDTYMKIYSNEITINMSNYKNIEDSRYGFRRFSSVIVVAEKEKLKNVSDENDLFIDSIKVTWGEIKYDKNHLGKVIEGLRNILISYMKRMTDEQIDEVNNSVNFRRRLAKTLGLDFIFTTED